MARRSLYSFYLCNKIQQECVSSKLYIISSLNTSLHLNLVLVSKISAFKVKPLGKLIQIHMTKEYELKIEAHWHNEKLKRIPAKKKKKMLLGCGIDWLFEGHFVLFSFWKVVSQSGNSTMTEYGGGGGVRRRGGGRGNYLCIDLDCLQDEQVAVL